MITDYRKWYWSVTTIALCFNALNVVKHRPSTTKDACAKPLYKLVMLKFGKIITFGNTVFTNLKEKYLQKFLKYM